MRNTLTGMTARVVYRLKMFDNQAVVSSSDLLLADIKNPAWIYEGWWGEGMKGIVAGAPKTMKSTIVLDFIFSAACRVPFQSTPPTKPEKYLKTLYVQNEMSWFILKDRVAKILNSKQPKIDVAHGDGTFTYREYDVDPPVSFVNPKIIGKNCLTEIAAFDALCAEVKKIFPDMIIVDPLYTYANTDLFTNTECQLILSRLDELQSINNSALMVVHHFNKASSKGGRSMAGSVFLHAWCECGWYIARKKSKSGEISLVIDREHRAYPSSRIELKMTMGRMGSFRYLLEEKQKTSSATATKHLPFDDVREA